MDMTIDAQFQALFHHFPKASEEGIFFERILFALREEERRRARSRAFGGAVMAFAAFAALIPASRELYSAVFSSGFIKYFSLLFSDVGSIGLYWGDFLSALSEAVPVFSVALVFGLFSLLLLGLRFFGKNMFIINSIKVHSHNFSAV